MAKQSNNENKPIHILNTQAAGKADENGNKFMKLEDIEKNIPDTPRPKVIFAEPWTDRAFLDQLQANNKPQQNPEAPAKPKIYWVFGDNTQDKMETQTKKGALRKGTGNQAGALEGMTHEEYSKVAVGVVTTQKIQGEDVSTAFKKSLEELYTMAEKNPAPVFVVPAQFKNGELKQINIGTGIAAKQLTPESVKAMTKAVQEVLTNIAKGEKHPVPDVELKLNLIHKAKLTFKKFGRNVQNLFKKTDPPKTPEKHVRFQESEKLQKPVTIAKHHTPKKQPERVTPPPRNIINPKHKPNEQNKGGRT